jgi:uncharacterized PurR-regulated membrane protein YhhQ (DUF165 family)
MLNNRITNWWMKLDPSEQYLYWIISFTLMLSSAVAMLITYTSNSTNLENFIPFLIAGVTAFVGFFMFVVVFLIIIWPHLYKKNKTKKNKK